MRFDLVRPCANCPFRTDVRPYLRRGRVLEIRRALLDRDQTFSCHKTVDWTREEDEEDDGRPAARHCRNDEQHCAGALILLEKLDQPNQLMRIMERLGVYDRRRLDMAAPVFGSFEDMARAQES